MAAPVFCVFSALAVGAQVNPLSIIKEENIGKISFVSSTLLVLVLTAVLSAIFVEHRDAHFERDLERVEQDYTEAQRDRLRSEVNMQISSINAWHNRTEQHLREEIKSRVYEAYEMADSIYRTQQNSHSDAAIQNLVIEALRPIRFYQGRGYFFIKSLQGDIVLNPPEPEFEGQNIYSDALEDDLGIFEQMKVVVEDSGEGFIKYKWPVPGDVSKTLKDKVSFVKHWPTYNWVIGTGEYHANIEEEIKQSIIYHLNSIVPDQNSPEYLFIYQLHEVSGGDEFATMLVNPNRPDLVGRKISSRVSDAKGLQYRQQMLRDIEYRGESFVTYWYKKPGTDTPVKKLSYFKYFPEWQWIVAKGTYLDDLEHRIHSIQDSLGDESKDTVRYLIYFTLISCSLVLCLGYIFSSAIQSLFETYRVRQKEQQDELERVNVELQVQATTDHLTSLYNREYFNDRLQQEIERAERYATGFSLILFDVDHFKQVNDDFGHLTGDAVLKSLSMLCQTTIRSSDIIVRWGGEEFVILAPDTEIDAAFSFAEKLRVSIEEHSFPVEVNVTCSFGVAQFIPGEEQDDLISRADKGLYQAKQAGRNRVVCLTE